MSKTIFVNQKINNLKTISVPGDKSLSIRWALFASLAMVSKATNLLMSEDVLAALKAIKKLGIKTLVNKKSKIFGKGIDGYKYKKHYNRCSKFRYLRKAYFGLLVNSPEPIKLVEIKVYKRF